jgi:PQQ-dependent dehydrogenase (methanol/ethanol family)
MKTHEENAMRPGLLIPSLAACGVITFIAGAHAAAPGTAAALADCCTAGDADFPKVGGNLGNQNYSSLAIVNKANVKELGAVWLNRIEGGINTGDNQSTPVVVDGVIYIESAPGAVVAVDGKTGATKWKYPGKGTQVRRGVAVGGGKVFTNARGGWVVALDQATGNVAWEVQPGNQYGNVGKVAMVYHDGIVYVGTTDANRNAALALDANTGAVVWSFFGAAAPGTLGGDTWGPVENRCYLTGGAAPWIHPAIDPELKLVFWTFGNARGCRSSQDGSLREGDNLFSSSIVAMDLKTGAYKWHFQSVHHNIWDMDNVMAPVLAEIPERGNGNGKTRKVVVYGSKTGMFYILDRADGSPVLGIDEVPVPQEPLQKTAATQPIPRQGSWTETCMSPPALGTAVPGDPNRAVPNFQTGCLYAAHWETPILSIPSQNGAADFGSMSFSPRTGAVYTGFAYVAAAHDLIESSNGLRAIGEYMTGGVVAVDVATNTVKWKKRQPYDMAHGVGILTTKGNVAFIGGPDGNFLALDAETGDELWRFQTGAAISSGPIAYKIGDEEYVAVYAGGTGIPYGNTAPRGDYLWAFKLGGTLPPAPTPAPPYQRRDVTTNPVEGSTVGNTVLLARTSGSPTAAKDSAAVSAMFPSNMRVPVGTTVTFKNPSDNAKPHCATQFFEGLFNPQLNPGETFTYTFNTAGEYFYNDCTDPRPTGKIVVY